LIFSKRLKMNFLRLEKIFHMKARRLKKTPRSITLLLPIALLFIFLCGFTRVESTYPTHSPLYWPAENFSPVWYYGINYKSDVDTILAAEAIKGAFAAWEEVECSYFKAQFGGFVEMGSEDFNGFSGKYDSVNLFTVADKNWPAEWNKGISLTMPIYDGASGSIFEADVIMNADPERGYKWSALAECADDYMDIQNVATHEIGHFLGLNHSLSNMSTMYYKINLGETSKRSLSADEIAGVCSIYPVRKANGSKCETSADCAKGECLFHRDSGGKICASDCKCDGDCPWYLTCSEGFCLPEEKGFGQMGEDCDSERLCDARLYCLKADGESVGYCTKSCGQQVSCPNKWNCVSTGAGGEFCVAPADGSGKIISDMAIKKIKIAPDPPKQGVKANISVEIGNHSGEELEIKASVRHIREWKVISEYSSSSEFSFVPDFPGAWTLRIETRKKSSDACYQAAKDYVFDVMPDGKPISIVKPPIKDFPQGDYDFSSFEDQAKTANACGAGSLDGFAAAAAIGLSALLRRRKA